MLEVDVPVVVFGAIVAILLNCATEDNEKMEKDVL
jgi:hypothetical protein